MSFFYNVDITDWEDHGDYISVSLDDVLSNANTDDLLELYKTYLPDEFKVPTGGYDIYDKAELAGLIKKICEVNHRIFTKTDLREALDELINFLPLAD